MVTAAVAILAVALGFVVAPGPSTSSAEAVPAGATWDPGFIVSDTLFYSGGAMSAGDVQSFLQGKGGRIASWTQATPSIAGNAYCGAYQGSSSERAADIIAKVGAACNISQRAILVTLQKEQQLVTATNPSDYAINHATGFGCPDTAACDPNVAGFFYQIYYAARQFQVYRLNPNSFNFQAGQTETIRYSPNQVNPSNPAQQCGSSQVYIKNSATAGLYDYTPYQPNQPAIANLNGTGDGCSTYGNRNFWAYWWNWFGDPHGGDPAWVDALYQDLLGHLPGNASQSWQNQALLSGWSRGDLVSTILTSSEYRSREVTAAYQAVLGRGPDSNGLAYWVGQTPPSGGTPASQVPLALLQSDELWTRAGGTAEGWVAMMYQEILGRAPDSAGLISWSNQVNSVGRAAVLSGIYNSPESANRRVNALFQNLLGRGPDPSALSYFASQAIARGDEYLAQLLASSAEYVTRAQQRFPVDAGIAGLGIPTAPQPAAASGTAVTATSFVDAMSQDLLGSAPDASTASSMLNQLASGSSRATLASHLYQSSAYRTTIVSRAYQTALGRPADSGGLSYWVGLTSMPASQIMSQFLATDEAYSNAGGTATSWVNQVFEVYLGRAPTSAELTNSTAQLASSGRSSVISSVYGTTESRTDRVTSLFQRLLGRAPSTSEISQYSADVNFSDEYVGAELLASVEYDARSTTRFPPAVLSAIASDLLGTPLESATLESWANALANGSTPYRIALDTYGGTAHRTRAITAVYQNLLGRAPDPSGLAYWLSVTAPGGSVRTSTVREQFLLTDEFYQKAGGTAEGWVSQMYQYELGRTPDPSGLGYWASQVRSKGRASVLWGIYNSNEAARSRVNNLATALLGRSATSDELSHYVTVITVYGDEYVGAAFIGTLDYASNAGRRF